MHREKLSTIFSEHLVSDKRFQEVLPIVRANTLGKIWLVGSAVYRTLAHKLYGGESPIKDFDFLCEEIKSPLSIPANWERLENRYGNPKLKKGELVIDIAPLARLARVKRRNLSPTIEHYLMGTPFTIQSIAYDIEENALLGEVGIKSILTKTISVNHYEEYEYARALYGESYSAQKYVRGLGFREV